MIRWSVPVCCSSRSAEPSSVSSSTCFLQPNGWLILWATLVVIGIISTFGPARGSIEGLIYTKHASKGLWGGMIEVLAQSFLLSAVTYYWVNHPDKTWLTWTLVGLFAVALALPALSLLASQGRLSRK